MRERLGMLEISTLWATRPGVPPAVHIGRSKLRWQNLTALTIARLAYGCTLAEGTILYRLDAELSWEKWERDTPHNGGNLPVTLFL